MTTLTMDHHGPSGVASLREPVASSSGLAMIYIVSGPQTRRGTPPPLVGAVVVSAALWCMFIAAVINTLVF